MVPRASPAGSTVAEPPERCSVVPRAPPAGSTVHSSSDSLSELRSSTINFILAAPFALLTGLAGAGFWPTKSVSVFCMEHDGFGDFGRAPVLIQSFLAAGGELPCWTLVVPEIELDADVPRELEGLSPLCTSLDLEVLPPNVWLVPVKGTTRAVWGFGRDNVCTLAGSLAVGPGRFSVLLEMPVACTFGPPWLRLAGAEVAGPFPLFWAPNMALMSAPLSIFPLFVARALAKGAPFRLPMPGAGPATLWNVPPQLLWCSAHQRSRGAGARFTARLT